MVERERERERLEFSSVIMQHGRVEEKVGLIDGMCTTFASQAWSAVHTRALV